jgi:hypothetical protein
VKLVGFDALAKTREIALVHGWRSWQRLQLHTLITIVSQRGEFRLEQLRIREATAAPADWIIHNIRINSVSTFAGNGVSGAEFRNPRMPLVMHAGSRFDIEVEYVGPLPGGALFEAALIGSRTVETSDADPTAPRSMGLMGPRSMRLMTRRPLVTRTVRDQLPIPSALPIRWSAPGGLRFLVMLGEEQWLFYRDKAEIRAVLLSRATELEREIADEWIADEGKIRADDEWIAEGKIRDDGPHVLDEPVVVSMHLHRDEEREMLCAMDDRHGRCLFSVGCEGASFAVTCAWPGSHMPAWLEAR